MKFPWGSIMKFEVKFSLMMVLLLLWNWVYNMATAFVFLFQNLNLCVF